MGKATVGICNQEARTEVCYLHVVNIMVVFASLIGRSHDLWIRRKREEWPVLCRERLCLEEIGMSLQSMVSNSYWRKDLGTKCRLCGGAGRVFSAGSPQTSAIVDRAVPANVSTVLSWHRAVEGAIK